MSPLTSPETVEEYLGERVRISLTIMAARQD